MTESIMVLICIAVMALGAIFGATAYDEAWRRDCEKLGMHVANGKVFTCSEGKSK